MTRAPLTDRGGIIYLARCRTTNRCYVGQTVQSLNDRWHQHLKQTRDGHETPLHRAIRKHGAEAFETKVLERLSTRAELNAAEVHWTLVHNAFAPNGYSLKAGNNPTCLSEPEIESRRRFWTRPEYRVIRTKQVRRQWRDTDTRPRMVEAMKHRGRKSWDNLSDEEKRAQIRRLHEGAPNKSNKRKIGWFWTTVLQRPVLRAYRPPTSRPFWFWRVVMNEPGRRLMIAAAARRQWSHADTRERIVSAIRAVGRDPEYRRKSALIAESLWKDPEVRSKRIDAMRRHMLLPEVRAANSARRREEWADPEIRTRHLQARPNMGESPGSLATEITG